MPDNKPQSFSSHTKWEPWFHFFIAPVFVINFVLAAWDAFKTFEHAQIHCVILAFAALAAIFRIRIYSLKVQDRLIRLEETLRMQKLLAEPLRNRIDELTPGQMVALRFASDGELSGLVEKALAGASNKEIKQQIKNWRPDHFRV